MGLKVIITGASGMVGKGVLLECLDNDVVEKVVTLNREPVGHEHSKHTQIIVPSFQQLDSIKEEIQNFDACYFCAGVTSVGKSEQEYEQITYDLTLNVAKWFIDHSPSSIFCYVSGTGTDSSENGRSMWARVKGKTENALLNMNFRSAYMFRPGYIQPLRGIRSKTGWYNALYSLFWPVYLILKFIPGAATNTSNMGKAMLAVTLTTPDERILHNRDIDRLAKTVQSTS
jgi:uncharacterized protein YbjT (DUF2867 family)